MSHQSELVPAGQSVEDEIYLWGSIEFAVMDAETGEAYHAGFAEVVNEWPPITGTYGRQKAQGWVSARMSFA